MKTTHATRIRIGIRKGKAHVARANCITRGRYIIKPVADPLEWKATTRTIRKAFRRGTNSGFMVYTDSGASALTIRRIPTIPTTLTSLSGKKKKKK